MSCCSYNRKKQRIGRKSSAGVMLGHAESERYQWNGRDIGYRKWYKNNHIITPGPRINGWYSALGFLLRKFRDIDILTSSFISISYIKNSRRRLIAESKLSWSLTHTMCYPSLCPLFQETIRKTSESTCISSYVIPPQLLPMICISCALLRICVGLKFTTIIRPSLNISTTYLSIPYFAIPMGIKPPE